MVIDVGQSGRRPSRAVLGRPLALLALLVFASVLALSPASVSAQTSSDATLSALTVSPKDIIGFDADRTSYEVGVASTVATATVTATPTDSDATVAYSGTDADGVAAGHQVRLSSGRNAVTVTVTAEDTTTTKEYTVSLNRGVTAEYGWKASDDLDGLIAAGNDDPAGVWSDGTTMWVADFVDDKIYAYSMATEARDSSKDFNTLSAASNNRPTGIWSDETTMWVADPEDDKIYAYSMATKARDSSKDFNTLSAASNDGPAGIWSDETTMWVADSSDAKLFAYSMATKARDSSKDFDTLGAASNRNIGGIWSDETTMWVADWTDDKIYAYSMATKAQDSSKEFNTLDAAGNGSPYGLWSDGTTLWASDFSDERLYSYNHPVIAAATTTATVTATGSTLVVNFDHDLAAAAPANSAFTVKRRRRGTESTVTLVGAPVVSGRSVKLTLASGLGPTSTDVKVSYTKPGSGTKLGWTSGNDVPSFADLAVTIIGLRNLSVSPKNINGFISYYPAYVVGVASTVATATVTAAPIHSDSTVTYSVRDADLSARGHQIALSAGNNRVKVTVTAHDGITKKEYDLSVNRGVTTEYGWNAGEDIERLFADWKVIPRGVWSDGTTIWVPYGLYSRLYAYNKITKARDSSKDFNTLAAAFNSNPNGIWSDGTTMWVSDFDDDKLYAYSMSTKARDESKDFDTLSGARNNAPRGLWSDGVTMWVVDWDDDKIYAYNLITKGRDSSKDFNTLAGASNNDPTGIWSDGATMWVADGVDNKIYAYSMSTKARDESKEFNHVASGPTGLWSDGTTIWVSDATFGVAKVYAYNLRVHEVSASATDGVLYNQPVPSSATAQDTPTPDPTLTSGESGPPESVPPESVPPESVPPESVPPESGPPESVPPESVPPESVPPESVPPESVPPESVPPESVPPESVPPESVPTRIGPPPRVDPGGSTSSGTSTSGGSISGGSISGGSEPEPTTRTRIAACELESGDSTHPFTDVPAASFAAKDVGCLFELKVTIGTTPTTYSPADLVTREHMALFLARLYEAITGELAPLADTPFTDIAASTAKDEIGRIYGLGVTTGTGDTTYSPADPVTREQMALFLARLYEAISGNPAPLTDTPFTDIAASTAKDEIGRIYGLGVTTGTGDTTYSPADPVTREQMASFLARLYRALTEPSP